MINISKKQSEILLSFCTITKNESDNIGRCLESVKAYVDELIVVDTGSEDKTVEIAIQHGAKIFYFPWCDDFSAAKNFSISQANGKWVLFLDADEELLIKDSKLISLLPKILTESDNLIFNICRKEIEEQNLTPCELQRLFRNIDNLKYVGKYHERLVFNGENVCNNQIYKLDLLEIQHYGYSMAQLKKKAYSRIDILEKIINEEIDLNILLTLAAMYEVTQQIDKFIKCNQIAYDYLLPSLLSGKKVSDFRAVTIWLLKLGISFLQEKNYENAIMLVQRGLEWEPNFAPFYYLSAEILMALEFYLGAIPYYEKCLDFFQQGNFIKSEPFDVNYISVYSSYRMGCAYADLQNWERALEQLHLSLKFNPEFKPAKEAILQIEQII